MLIPFVIGQCATKTGYSFANGGKSPSGKREDFMDNASVRNIMTLFRGIPLLPIGWTPFVGVNCYDVCPCLTILIILICPCWVIAIAMERAELINIFAEHAKELGAHLWIGSAGGTSTGADLIFKYLNLSYFDGWVKKVTHITNASTPRWRRGWGWPSELAQIVYVTRYFTKFSHSLMKFYESHGKTPTVSPLDAAIACEKMTFVRKLTSDMDAMFLPSRPSKKSSSSRKSYSPEAIAAYKATGLFCVSGGRLRRVCEHPGCDKGALSRKFCSAHGGGNRCEYLGGCDKGAQSGTKFCSAHGGSDRCKYLGGCTKGAQSRGLCSAHGGGDRCKHHSGCTKGARSRGLCIAHGGGKRCKHHSGCTKGSQSRGLCSAHGGGKRR